MPDDEPSISDHHYCSVEGTADRTEVYVVQKNEFKKWYDMMNDMPDESIELGDLESFKY